jgi:hypothetical protein
VYCDVSTTHFSWNSLAIAAAAATVAIKNKKTATTTITTTTTTTTTTAIVTLCVIYQHCHFLILHSLIIIQSNSVQFKGYLLTHRLNSTSAYYKVSIKHKSSAYSQSKTPKRQNKIKYYRKKYDKTLGQEP